MTMLPLASCAMRSCRAAAKSRSQASTLGPRAQGLRAELGRQDPHPLLLVPLALRCALNQQLAGRSRLAPRSPPAHLCSCLGGLGMHASSAKKLNTGAGERPFTAARFASNAGAAAESAADVETIRLACGIGLEARTREAALVSAYDSRENSSAYIAASQQV